jgi:phosphoribosyl 1,2-cyclic phosphate phosphodiesterase
MKIKFWGTGAAEGIPCGFCGCPVCQEARKMGGRYQRTRAQVMIDDDLLVDMGPDTYTNALRAGYDLSQLENVLITHSHGDHFYPMELHNRQIEFAYDMKYPTLQIYSSDDVSKCYIPFMAGSGQYLINQKRVALNVLEPYTTQSVGEYKVTSLPATHGTGRPFVYIIEKGGKTVFYLNDSGTLKDEVFDWLATTNFKLDLVIYDCTHAMRNTRTDQDGKFWSHMGQPNNIDTRERLTKMGLYTDKTISVETHFSHNGISVGYGDFAPLAEKEGFICAYDGMELDI